MPEFGQKVSGAVCKIDTQGTETDRTEFVIAQVPSASIYSVVKVAVSVRCLRDANANVSRLHRGQPQNFTPNFISVAFDFGSYRSLSLDWSGKSKKNSIGTLTPGAVFGSSSSETASERKS